MKSSIIALAIIIVIATTAIITSQLVKNRFSLKPFAAGDVCVDGIVQSSIQLLRSDGTVINNNEVINDVTGIKCKVRVQGVAQADKYLKCAIRKDQYWPVGCPSNVLGVDFTHDIITWDTDIFTTFHKCDQDLLNPPAGHPQLSPGMRLEVVAARFTTGDPNQCLWNDPNKYVTGPTYYFQQGPQGPSNTPIPSPTTQPGATSTPVPTPAACSGNSCTDCVINNGPSNLLDFYQQNGWDISCLNQTNIVNNWCTIVNPVDCNQIKSGVCASQCNLPTSTPIPTSPQPTPTTQPGCTRKSEGDANCDGKIDLIDFSLWVHSQCAVIGASCGDLTADFDGDGDVDYHDDTNGANTGDYEIWVLNRYT